MKTMTPSDKDQETEKLTHILSQLQSLYYKKKDRLIELELEISELQSTINSLNTLITGKSFASADELLKAENYQTDDNDYFKENLPEEKFKGTSIKRKIFSTDKHKEEDLLCVLNLMDLQKVEIKFIDPDKRAIRETSENFISTFLRGALIKIKEGNPNLEVNYKFYKESDKIEKIFLSNLTSIKDYDLITEKVRELLAYEKND